MFIFLVLFSGVLVYTDKFKFFTTVAFCIGALTSIVSGYIGMLIATRSNVRVAYQAATHSDKEQAMKQAFNVAFRGGCVMGFCLVSLALATLTGIIYGFIGKVDC